MVRVKRFKGKLNTYSKKKPQNAPTIIINNVTHINYTSNTYINLTSSSSSEDKFDKLLKGPTYHAPKRSSLSSSSRDEMRFFHQRQTTISLYNSDATLGSDNVSSVHLFKDICKDSYEIYSPSNLPSPHYIYNNKNKKLKVARKQKKTNRVVKTTQRKAQHKNRFTPEVMTLMATSSTPTHPHLPMSQDRWNALHVSPIMPVISKQPSGETNLFPIEGKQATQIDTSGDLFALEQNVENKSDTRPPSALGITALAEGLCNLGLVTPCAKTKENNISKATPSQLSIVKNDIVLRASRCKTQHFKKGCKDSFEVKGKSNSFSEKVTSISLFSQNLKKDSFESDLGEVCKETMNDESDFLNQRQTRSKYTMKSASSKKTMDDSSFLKPKEKEHLEHSSLRLQELDGSVNLPQNIHAMNERRSSFTAGEELWVSLSCSKNTVNADISSSKITEHLDILSLSQPSQIAEYVDPVYSRSDFTKQDVSPQSCINDLSVDLGHTRMLEHLRFHPSPKLDKCPCPSHGDCDKVKKSLNLQPGKRWRRSFLKNKQAGLYSKDLILKSTNSIPGVKQTDDLSCKVDNGTSLEMSMNNSVFNYPSEILRYVSIRGKKWSKKKNYEDSMYSIDEESLCLANDGASLCKTETEHFIEASKPDLDATESRLDSSVVNLDMENISEESFDKSKGHVFSSQTESHIMGLSVSKFESIDSRLESPKVNKVDNQMFANIPFDDSDDTFSNNAESDEYEEGADLDFDTSESSETHTKCLLQPSVNETPIKLKMNADALNTITKRRKTYRKSLKFLNFSKEDGHSCCNSFSNDDYNASINELTNEGKYLTTPTSDNEKDVSCFIENIEEDEVQQMGELGVMLRCGLQSPLPFEEAFPEIVLKNSQKIGEGVYGEVFMLNRPTTGKSVVKIIPVEGSQLVNNEPQKLFSEVLSEIIISEELSLLRENSHFCTSGFCELKNKFCLIGKYPPTLIELWDKFHQSKGSDNDCPDMFECDQLYIALELDHAGEPIETYRFKSAKEAYSVLLQTVFSLAVAEDCLEFEHRDLHIGNVLVKSTLEDYVKLIHNGVHFKLPTYKTKATIIDFTLSRISFKNDVLFYDMAKDPELFTAEGDYQFEIYRLMREDLEDKWINHAPVTNIRWLHYLVDKFVTQIRYSNNKTKAHTEYLNKLTDLRNNILSFLSSSDLAKHILQTDNSIILSK